MNHRYLAFAFVMLVSSTVRAQSFDLAIDFDGSGSGAALLAAHLPADKQAALEGSFDQLLGAYRQIEAKYHVAKDEPAGALAAFVVGNLAAARHATISDATFSAVVGQLRGALRSHPDLARTLHIDRLPVREELEIIGMLMMASSLGKSDANQAAALEAGAKRYLSSYLGVDAQAIDLSDQGLVWTAAATGPLALLTGKATTQPTAPASTRDDHGGDVATQIEAVGTHLDSYYAGTTYTYFEKETWMFKDRMCTGSVKRVFEAGSLAADRRDHPKEWAKCRRIKDDIEQFDGKSWKKLDLYMRDRLPSGFTLEGKFANEQFQTTAGPYGGAYASWNKFAFDKTGHFETGSGAGGSTTGVAVNSRGAPARGTYAIDGYVITLRFDDGRVERRTFYADPKKLDHVYINGINYRR